MDLDTLENNIPKLAGETRGCEDPAADPNEGSPEKEQLLPMGKPSDIAKVPSNPDMNAISNGETNRRLEVSSDSELIVGTSVLPIAPLSTASGPIKLESDILAEKPEDQVDGTPGGFGKPVGQALSNALIHELDTGYRILTDIIKQNKSTCWPFMDEVDIKGLGLWDYNLKIKESMWLNKLIEKFDKGLYSSITEFVKDFRTVVENCYRYNTTDHSISKKAKRLEMALEGKLALLKKDLRDKTSLHITSGGKFSVDMSDEVSNSLTRSGRAGNMREYASIHDDVSAKLVYDFVKCEETVLLDDERKASHRERRQQELLYQRIAAAWINALDTSADAKLIKTCSGLPEIGFFLHLCEAVLKFPELNMYSLERSFLIPEDSIYLSKIMTSLLCSYQERSQIVHRPPMHFSTWNKRLKERVSKWFESAQKCKSYINAAEKLGISVTFFERLDWINPFSQEKTDFTYADLSFMQRVEVVKALCDSMFLLQSIQSAMQAMDASQLQCMELGKDCYGNIYVYFPQFCGDDVRVYRHREYGEPVYQVIPEVDIPVKNTSETANKSTEPMQQAEVATSNPLADQNITEHPEEQFNDPTDSKTVNAPETLNVVANTAPEMDLSTNHDMVNGAIALPEQSGSENGQVQSDSAEKTGEKNFVIENGESEKGQAKCTEDDLTTERRTPRSRKRNPKYDEDATFSRQSTRRSARKRNQPQMFQVETKRETSSPKKKKKVEEKKKNPVKKVKKEPPARYGNVEFEMLCDGVNGILNLVNDLENQQKQPDIGEFGKTAIKECSELIERLRWLHGELEPWDSKMQKAKLAAQIQMKREHDELKNTASSKWLDLWSEELTNKNTYMLGDNLTIAHHNVDSPMSSVASYDGDTGDEDYIHPYFTRKTASPPPPQFDEELYRDQREHLLQAALHELEAVLKKHKEKFFKLADRAELQENVSSGDGRRTRQKLKQQNKVLGKILVFAEDRAEESPSLLPILVPDNDVSDLIEVLLTEEESRRRQVALEQKRKRKNYIPKRPKPVEKNILKETLIKKDLNGPGTVKRFFPQGVSNLAIRMNNGKVYPATRLSDGSVVPIARSNKNSPVAASVQDLIESISGEKRKMLASVPHISLRSPKLTPRKSFATSTQDDSAPGAAVKQQAAAVQSPPRTMNSTLSLGTVTVKRSPVRVGVHKASNAVPRQIQDPRNAVVPNAKPPPTLNQAGTPPVAMRQVNAPVSPQPPPSVSNVVAPVTCNFNNYRLVNFTQPSYPAANAVALSRPHTYMNNTQAIFLSPSSHTIVRPIITPVHLITTTVKYPPSSPSTKAGNMVFVPLQNCAGAGVTPVQIVTNPVMQVITSPQKQSQVLGNSSK